MLAALLFVFGAAVADATPETITVGCSMKRCTDVPANEWDQPACDDFQLDVSLEQSAKARDRSAIALLERRFRTAFSQSERVLIATMLLGRAAHDSEYWDFLYPLAEDEARYGAFGEEERFEKYRRDHGLPREYEESTFDAFAAVANDRRSRPLLIEVLRKSSDDTLVTYAIYGLVWQHDESALPAIDEALRRMNEAEIVATSLALLKSAAADTIAFKYIPEEHRAEYREFQAQCSR